MAVQKWGPITLLFAGQRISLYGAAELFETGSEVEAGANEDGTARLSEQKMPFKAEFPLFVDSGIVPAELHGQRGDAVFFSPTSGRVFVYQDAEFIVNGSTNSRTGELGNCMVVSDQYYSRTLAA